MIIRDLYIQYFSYLCLKAMKNMDIFVVNRNEEKYVNSFTICSDLGNNSTDRLSNELIYAHGISLSPNA